MRTTLTIEQSAELIKRGVSSDKASAAVIYLDYAGEEVEPHKVFKREGDGVLLTRLRNESVIGVEAKIVFKDSGSNYSTSIFTLDDLLSLLPKEIDIDGYPYRISIYFENPDEPVIGNQWCLYYKPKKHNEKSRIDDVPMYAPDLIECAVLMVEWLTANGYKLNDCPCQKQGGKEQ